MLNIIFGPAGTGKTEYIYSSIKKQLEENKDNIILLVPEQNSFTSEKRIIELFGASSSEKIEVLSFTRLVQLFEVKYGTIAAEQADDAIKLVVMQRAIKNVKHLLNTYSKTCDNTEFAVNMINLVTELKQSKITEEMLRKVSADVSGSIAEKTADISIILSAYNALMSDKFKDPLECLNYLSVQLDKHSYFENKQIYIDAFEFFTEQQYEIISKMLLQADDVYVALCTDNIKYDEFSLFANVNKVLKRLCYIAKTAGIEIASYIEMDKPLRFKNNQLKCVESLIKSGQKVECDGDNITICSCPTVYEECDYVARTIKKLVRTQNYRFRDFAVIARDMTVYKSILCDALDKYSVEYFCDNRIETDSLVLVRFLVNALQCVCNNYQNQYFSSYIKSPLCGISFEDASMLDNYAFVWNKRGRKWLEEFKENPDGADCDKFDYEKLEHINNIRRKATEGLIQLEKEISSGNTKSVCKAIYNFLIREDVQNRLKQYCRGLSDLNEHLLRDVTVKSWDTVVKSLDTIIKIAGEDRINYKELVQMYINLIYAQNIGHVPDRIDEVVLGSADRIRTASPKITFIIGANFGEFPRPVNSAGLFTLRDRRRLIESGLDISDYSVSGVTDEKFFVYNALCTPSQGLYITYHCSDFKGNSTSRSEFVELLQNNVFGVKFINQSDTVMDKSESELSSLELVLNAQYFKYAQSLDEYFAKSGSVYSGVIGSVVNSSEEIKLKPENAIDLFGKDIGMSASRAEVYAKCPFSYFCKFGLKVEDIQAAELDVRQKGTLVHSVLEDIIMKYSIGLSDMSDEDLRDAIEKSTDEFVEQHFGQTDLTDSFMFLISRIKILLFYLLRHIGQEFAQSQFKPDRYEAKIGSDEINSLTIPLQTGNLKIGGSVDRVDVFEMDDTVFVRVIDYKTGSKTFDLSDVMYGLNMQMLIYLFAIIDSNVYENSKASGILYLPAKRVVPSALRSDSDDVISQEKNKKLRMNGLVLNDDEVITAMEKEKQGVYIPYSQAPRGIKSVASESEFALIKDKVYSVLKQIGDSIHNGDIAVKPLDATDSEACKYCDYSSVCRRELNSKCGKVEKTDMYNIFDCLRRESNIETH